MTAIKGGVTGVCFDLFNKKVKKCETLKKKDADNASETTNPWRNDCQHNDTQDKDTRFNRLNRNIHQTHSACRHSGN